MTLALSAGYAVGAEWVLTNPTGAAYKDEPIRLNVVLPATAKQGDYVVKADGTEVPYQIEEIDGYKYAWVLATAKPHGKVSYTIARGRPKTFKPLVKVEKRKGEYLLDNGVVAARVPGPDAVGLVGPVGQVRLPDGKWVGGSSWHTDLGLREFTAELVQNGPIFAKLRLRYDFEGLAGYRGDVPAFAQVDVALYPGQNHLVVEESHEMGRGDFWEFDCTAGWNGRKPMCVIYQGDPGHGADPNKWPKDLVPLGFSVEASHKHHAERLSKIGNTLLWLVPRWNQSYWDGWVFTVSNPSQSLGAMVARAGKWVWPHDNKIEVRAKESGDYAGLRCSTFQGARYWFLVTAPAGFDAGRYMKRHGHFPLDKLVQDIIYEWPGKDYAGRKDGGFWMIDPYDANHINPTGPGRRMNGASAQKVGQKGGLTELTQVQVMLHPDTYGSYWNYWSPENPNFYSDWIMTPVNLATTLREHPRFAEIALKVQLAALADPYFGVTLPGGAGQECPGYMGLMHWQHCAKLIAEYMHYDITTRPWIREARLFRRLKLHFAQGDNYMCPPYGDSHGGCHPEKVDMNALKKLTTEELPGFGVVFRRNPGSPRETHLAFKSGPNRGHYHGDQLAVLYSANRNYLLADHGCSYRPRPGQEHMHNRVVFFTDEFPYMNMDGYERLIAYKPGKGAAIAIGQVESPRFRWVKELPPEDWHREYPQVKLDPPLVYRRTVVHVSGNKQDYFVIRDQYRSPIDVGAACTFHVRDDDTPSLIVAGRGKGADSDGSRTITDAEQDFEKLGIKPGWKLNWENAYNAYDVQKRFSIVGVSGNSLTLDKEVPAAKKHPCMIMRPLYQHAGSTIKFKNLTLFCARPAAFDLKFFPWWHAKEGGEGTQGVRLETRGKTGEYVTVLYPSAEAPAMSALPGGVKVGSDEIIFAGGIDEVADAAYVTVKRDGRTIETVSGNEMDLNRDQGNVGLFVPDAGYPFGPIPSWLLAQRAQHPDWYHKLAKIDRMRGTDDDIRQLIALAGDKDPMVRGAAVRIFGTKGSAKWLPAFRDATKQIEDANEKKWAEKSIAQVQSGAAQSIRPVRVEKE